MLDYVFQGIQAYNQVGFFLGAVVLLGLGGLILGNSLYWRIQGTRVTGTIIGVINRGGTYTPVYQYTSPDEQTHNAKSDTSSGSTCGKETGRKLSLLIAPHDPTHARAANDFLFDAIGIFLVIPGLWLGHTALTAYPITWMTWVMAAAFSLYLGERAYRVFIPKGQRLSLGEWRQQHGINNSATLDLSGVLPIEQIVSTAEVQQKLETQRKNNRRAAPIVAVFAIALFAAGIYQVRNVAQLAASGIRTEGEVVRLVSQSGSGGHYSYYPVVRFRTDANLALEFKDSVGSSPPVHRLGDKVAVLYLSANPGASAVIDHGLFWNWVIPMLLIAAAGLLVWLLLSMLKCTINRKPLRAVAS
jgi:hypothetical protein